MFSVHSELSKDLSKRLKKFKLCARKPDVKEWKGTSVISNVYDIEMQQRFKSLEERLIYRMEVWIDVCRIETVYNGVITNGAGKFHSAKRFKKHNNKSTLTKVRSFSLGKLSSKSVDNLATPVKIASKQEEMRSLSPAYSTNDLILSNTTKNTNTRAKRKFRLFWFGKKHKQLEDIDENAKKRKRSSNKLKRVDSDTSQISFNNNVNNVKNRPSIFAMQSLQDSLPDFMKLSADGELNNVLPSQQQETLFKIPHKDSFRTKQSRSYSLISRGPMFYEPLLKEAEIGEI